MHTLQTRPRTIALVAFPIDLHPPRREEPPPAPPSQVPARGRKKIWYPSPPSQNTKLEPDATLVGQKIFPFFFIFCQTHNNDFNYPLRWPTSHEAATHILL